jgi:hypothetical protein
MEILMYGITVRARSGRPSILKRAKDDSHGYVMIETRSIDETSGRVTSGKGC